MRLQTRVKMQSECQRYRLKAEENVAVSRDDAVLSETLEVTVDVPNLSVSDYRTRYGLMLDACRVAYMFSNDRSRTMVSRCGMRHDADIGAWERRSALMRPWCAATISPARPFDMPSVRHVVEVAYASRL